ncbi:exported hypothetical protein [Syntrophobacter sp. SbD1]|nr:exported hypothetical protein [Syntrophobacter sp. SbD1]
MSRRLCSPTQNKAWKQRVKKDLIAGTRGVLPFYFCLAAGCLAQASPALFVALETIVIKLEPLPPAILCFDLLFMLTCKEGKCY